MNKINEIIEELKSKLEYIDFKKLAIGAVWSLAFLYTLIVVITGIFVDFEPNVVRNIIFLFLCAGVCSFIAYPEDTLDYVKTIFGMSKDELDDNDYYDPENHYDNGYDDDDIIVKDITHKPIKRGGN